VTEAVEYGTRVTSTAYPWENRAVISQRVQLFCTDHWQQSNQQ